MAHEFRRRPLGSGDDVTAINDGATSHANGREHGVERCENANHHRNGQGAGWRLVHHKQLPKWLDNNEFIVDGHRPPMSTFHSCFLSIFRIHTETGNIWSHLLGFVAFVALAFYFLNEPSPDVAQWHKKLVYSAFFFGAVVCLGFSWMYHTVSCHSEHVGRFFHKLDYCGIAMLIMGSFVPWLYYSFFCQTRVFVFYTGAILVLGTTCIVVSMWEKFAAPKFRPVRAGVFIGLGLSGVIPAMHVVITNGFWSAVNHSALGWLSLMAVLYIVGALIYAARVPERIWPGRFDIWCQSHQIFHMFVVIAALVHYHGINQLSANRILDCPVVYHTL